MKKIFVVFSLSFLLFSCDESIESTYDSESGESSVSREDDETYNTDENYKYNNRTGTSGDYDYNYDINGTDGEGNSVNGNIDINGKYGSGTIQDENGDEKNIDVEWVGKGQLEGTDDEGNSYDLEVE